MARYIDADALKTAILTKYRGNWEIPCSSEDRLIQRVVTDLRVLIEQSITADVAPKSEVAREIFEKIKRSKVTLGYPAKIICYRATPTGEVKEIVEDWVVPQSCIEYLEKKYIGGKTDEDISD